MFFACGRQFVNTDAAIGGGHTPFGADQFIFEQALESGVEGAFFDLKQIVRGALDVLNQGIAVERLALERAENHDLEGAGEEIALFVGFRHERVFI
jgi:hypothetical protein